MGHADLQSQQTRDSGSLTAIAIYSPGGLSMVSSDREAHYGHTLFLVVFIVPPDIVNLGGNITRFIITRADEKLNGAISTRQKHWYKVYAVTKRKKKITM